MFFAFMVDPLGVTTCLLSLADSSAKCLNFSIELAFFPFGFGASSQKISVR